MPSRLPSLRALRNRISHFGFTPAHLVWRISGRCQAAVLANSIPKAGTNLLIQTLNLMFPMYRKFRSTFTTADVDILRDVLPRRGSGAFLAAHLHYSPENEHIVEEWGGKHILMVRDPRDLALSNAEYLARGDRSHRLYKYFSEKLATDHERLTASICGVDKRRLGLDRSSKSIGWHIDNYMGWLVDEQCLIVKFEDIIGPLGGGSADAQIACIRKIAAHIGMSYSDEDVGRIADRVFSVHSRTFNKGQVGRWKERFSPEHREIFRGIAGESLLVLGYERDHTWIHSV